MPLGIVLRDNARMRLDQAIAARFGISRRKAREHIGAGRVQVDRRRVAVASREITGSEELLLLPEVDHALRVLSLNPDWVALDKPAGIPTQPARDRATVSLEDLARAEYRTIFPVHRLDTPTSGVVLFARSRGAAATLSALFAGGDLRKVYVAIAEGVVQKEITITTPVREKPATSVVTPVRKAEHGTLVKVEISTGRTHQIRIHLASIGHPVAGDRRYGSTINASRLMLHAWQLEHASIGLVEAPIPPEFV